MCLSILQRANSSILVTFLLAPEATYGKTKIEDNKAKKQRKLHIFKTLMATRAARLSAEHVQALNMIDLVRVKRHLT
jgi:hypothetical protein